MRKLRVLARFATGRFIMRRAIRRMIVHLAISALHGFVVPGCHAEPRHDGRHALDRHGYRDDQSEEAKKL